MSFVYLIFQRNNFEKHIKEKELKFVYSFHNVKSKRLFLIIVWFKFYSRAHWINNRKKTIMNFVNILLYNMKPYEQNSLFA